MVEDFGLPAACAMTDLRPALDIDVEAARPDQNPDGLTPVRDWLSATRVSRTHLSDGTNREPRHAPELMTAGR